MIGGRGLPGVPPPQWYGPWSRSLAPGPWSRSRSQSLAPGPWSQSQYCTVLYTLYKKIKKAKLKKNSSFRRFLKKSLWNHFKKSETFTNRSGLKNQYQRWVSCTLFVGRMTISLKNIEIFKRNTIFQGADFRNFRKSRFLDF